MKKKDIDRFMSYVMPEPNTGCWFWTGAVIGKGRKAHGVSYANGKRILAHRLSFIIHKDQIPEGLIICHHCDNPRCVNPDHLYAGTDQQNAMDKVRRGRNRNPVGEKHGRAVYTEDIVTKALEMRLQGHTNVFIAKTLSIHERAITDFAAKKSWAHIDFHKTNGPIKMQYQPKRSLTK